MTEKEAIKEVKRWTSILMSAGSKCVSDTAEAQDMAINALEQVQQYREIGTLEERRAAVEKQNAKKPIIEYEQTHDCVTEIEWKCPTCGTNYIELAPCGEWCCYCGTKLDWSDEE